MVARRLPRSQPFPSLKPAFTLLQSLIDEPDSRSNLDKAESTDNLIGAFGKFILYHLDNNLITLTHLREFLAMLPLYSDSDEAQAIHKLLFEEVIKGNEVLAMAGNEVR